MRDAVAAFTRRFALTFVAAYTREDGPPKPSPHGVHLLCDAMGVPPADTLTVGDYKYDVIAARAAGSRAALVMHPPPDDLAAWGSPDLVIRSLRELVPLWDAHGDG
jgi:phosphoglycolate phosphatase-like HAD superfamily hydrolase